MEIIMEIIAALVVIRIAAHILGWLMAAMIAINSPRNRNY